MVGWSFSIEQVKWLQQLCSITWLFLLLPVNRGKCVCATHGSHAISRAAAARWLYAFGAPYVLQCYMALKRVRCRKLLETPWLANGFAGSVLTFVYVAAPDAQVWYCAGRLAVFLNLFTFFQYFFIREKNKITAFQFCLKSLPGKVLNWLVSKVFKKEVPEIQSSECPILVVFWVKTFDFRNFSCWRILIIFKSKYIIM